MKVTFNSIEKIYNLLTTEECIDKKDPKKRLEQNFDQLNTNDEKYISNI